MSDDEDSPCINVCILDEEGEECIACGQSIDELKK
jgi:predicted Fe-S protein YdhL (DUF1289 family)